MGRPLFAIPVVEPWEICTSCGQPAVQCASLPLQVRTACCFGRCAKTAMPSGSLVLIARPDLGCTVGPICVLSFLLVGYALGGESKRNCNTRLSEHLRMGARLANWLRAQECGKLDVQDRKQKTTMLANFRFQVQEPKNSCNRDETTWYHILANPNHLVSEKKQNAPKRPAKPI